MARAKESADPFILSESTLYLSHHLRSVDNGRVILPPDWRLEGTPKDLVITPRPAVAPRHLLVVPVARWEAFVKNLEAAMTSNQQAGEVESVMSESTTRRVVDNYGRLALPEDALKALGISSEVMLVGRMNKFEIWEPAKYQAYRSKIDLGAVGKLIDSVRI